MKPAQGRTLLLLVKMEQLVVGPRMEGIEPLQRLVKGGTRQLPPEEPGPAGQLGPVVPAFFIVVVQAEQLLHGMDGSLLADLVAGKARKQALFLHAGLNEELLPVASACLAVVGFLQGLLVIALSPPLQGPAEPP